MSKTVFLLIYCEFKTNFIAESIIIHGVSAYESVNKRKIQSSFSKHGDNPRRLTREGPLMGMCKHRKPKLTI